MNYYIQGNEEKADQIKAAFEKLGCDVTGFDMCNDNILFFTYKSQNGGQVVSTTNANLYTANIIKTHPDYKELELSVEPMFKDGDVLVTTKIRSCPFIYRKPDFNNDLAYYYVGIDGNGDLSIGWPKRKLFHFGLIADAVIAGQGQRDFLFAKIKEAGYEWDANKKELRKIKPHYDISNFNPFDKVLVRDYEDCVWNIDWFGFYRAENKYHFRCNSNAWCMCIPFNDDTKHLLGTTDTPDEYYINW